ncbi:protein mono-ADP-ribosyltransferase PARP9 [Brachyhypopomus gauderio]|uniref:protein mono-ADP-ribosyltransferase PARP9 n=1 Tax=Brachyhypopomus gauderio TaxID=698409 RepID=UPI00404298E4
MAAMSTKAYILLSPEGIEIVKQSHYALCTALKGKFGCTAVVHNVDVPTTSSPGRANSTQPEMKYSKPLANGLKISVWKDDLTAHRVDAVVNAANEDLNHAGGLALALSKAGGPIIQQMSNQLVNQYGKVPTGKAFTTPAGNLPCKMIIHAVGPCVSPNPTRTELEKAAGLLENAVWSILELTEYNNLKSVAIPAVSSGLYNFPRDICANIIVNTVKCFSDNRTASNGSLDLRLVNNDDPTVQEMLRACMMLLGPSDHMGQWVKSEPSQTRTRTGPAYPSVDLGNITLLLKKGAIENEAADVIVNTVGRTFDLSGGQISKAILDKAGYKMQYEIRKHRIRPTEDGSVISTGAYKLNCKAVYHTVCAQKSSSYNADKILHSVVMKCLSMASKDGFSSLAFPTIGTGNLGFRNEDVSKIMMSAVQEFAQTHRGKKMDVYFVIFSQDIRAFEAFERELALLEKTSAAVTSSSTGKGSSFDDYGTTPGIELFANSHEALREAQRWTDRMLHFSRFSADVENNLIMHLGQQDHANLKSFQTIFNVFITESFRKGKCGITITGERPVAVACAAIEVESMLCQAQDVFAQTEEEDLLHSVVRWEDSLGSERVDTSTALEKAYLAGVDTVSMNGKTFKVDCRLGQAKTEQGQQLRRTCFFSLYSSMPKLTSGSYYERTPRPQPNSTETERWKKIKDCGLKIMKVEKIENYALEQLFQLNKKRVSGEPQWLYQCVTAQFCDHICRIGFQREYAPPAEQRCGAGIYFTSEVGRVLRLWENWEEDYVYIFEAQVLTGKSTVGSPELIVPPPTGSDPLVCYNSVTNDVKDVHVIFHSQQALPRFLLTCINTRTNTSTV